MDSRLRGKDNINFCHVQSLIVGNNLRYTIYNIDIYIHSQEIIMNKVLISIPDDIAARMRTAIPPRQRSKVIVRLIEAEVNRREKKLYECAVAVENDQSLNEEMEDWDITLQDGLNNETW
jgi:hypothetical protein